MAPTEPERFWDERARENALFYVDDQVDYGDPDTEAFWRRGDETLEKILSPLGQTVSSDAVVAPTEESRAALRRWLAIDTPTIDADDAGGHDRLYRTLLCATPN